MTSSGKKLDEAKEILAALGMPAAQQSPIARYTLAAFADVGPRTPWSSASAPRLRLHDVIEFARSKFRKVYAENTRETIRRHAIHQFVQGGVLVRNPDRAQLATNSPLTRYALTPEALAVLRAFGTPAFAAAGEAFRGAQAGGLAARYAKPRHLAGVAVPLPDDTSLSLSPGAHNQLHAQIIQLFLPRFAAGARVLYLGDTDHKSKLMDEPRLAAVGVPVNKHDKLPDVVLHDEARNWLFLIEAVTTHGPVSPKRHMELEAALVGSTAGRVYVSAFASFGVFKKHAANIAWETEVWVADAPGHLLHYNGDRFFGPRSP